MATTLSDNALHIALAGTWHLHTCANDRCRLIYECRGTAGGDGTMPCDPRANELCRTCRGQSRADWITYRDGRPCCALGTRKIVDRQELLAYHLAGARPWHQCLVCARPTGWPTGYDPTNPPPYPRAHTQSYAHTFAQAVDNPTRGDDHPMTTKTTTAPATFLSGWCTPGATAAQHAACCTTLRNGNGVMLQCRCSCHSDSATAQDAAAAVRQETLRHMGEHGNATTMTLGEALAVQQTELQRVADDAGVTPETITGPTSWRAEEVADLMVELDTCPLCSTDWPDHVFTDDDRVVCP